MKGLLLALVATGLTTLAAGTVDARHAGAPGALDPSFGVRGGVLTAVGGRPPRAGADAVVVQRDGKIIAAGAAFLWTPIAEEPERFALVRYTPRGRLDRSFGRGGKVLTRVGNVRRQPGLEDSSISTVAVDPAGRIVAVGAASRRAAGCKANPGEGLLRGTGRDVAVVRYTRRGTLDETFGLHGKAFADLHSCTDRGWYGVLQPDGKIVVAGESSGNFALVRFRRDGRLDRSFGRGGFVRTDFGSSEDSAWALALQANGRLVAAGHTGETLLDTPRLALARYMANGRLDRSFGTAGKLVHALGGAGGIALQRDGRIVVAGSGERLFVARFAGDGTLDRSFGAEGTVLFGEEGEADAVLVHSSGRILVAAPPGIARLTESGRLDQSFGRGGRIVASAATALALQRDGKLVLAGGVGTGRDELNFTMRFVVERRFAFPPAG